MNKPTESVSNISPLHTNHFTTQTIDGINSVHPSLSQPSETPPNSYHLERQQVYDSNNNIRITTSNPLPSINLPSTNNYTPNEHALPSIHNSPFNPNENVQQMFYSKPGQQANYSYQTNSPPSSLMQQTTTTGPNICMQERLPPINQVINNNPPIRKSVSPNSMSTSSMPPQQQQQFTQQFNQKHYNQHQHPQYLISSPSNNLSNHSLTSKSSFAQNTQTVHNAPLNGVFTKQNQNSNQSSLHAPPIRNNAKLAFINNNQNISDLNALNNTNPSTSNTNNTNNINNNTLIQQQSPIPITTANNNNNINLIHQPQQPQQQQQDNYYHDFYVPIKKTTTNNNKNSSSQFVSINNSTLVNQNGVGLVQANIGGSSSTTTTSTTTIPPKCSLCDRGITKRYWVRDCNVEVMGTFSKNEGKYNKYN